MSQEKYPLKQVATIKQKRLEEAEKVLREKKEVLAKEEEKLSQLEKKRDEVKAHYQDKLTQLRAKLDQGESTSKITQMKQYLKIVYDDLAAEEKKVTAQAKVVAAAEEQVEAARQELFKKQKDVEKLSIHHQEWKKGMKVIEERLDESQSDEMGTVMHNLKKKEKRVMTNAPNPPGPANPIDPGRSSEPVKPGTDKFKEYMKIGASSEKQKKKKKRSEEAEEEKKASLHTKPVSANKTIKTAGKTNQFPKVEKVSEDEIKRARRQHALQQTEEEMAAPSLSTPTNRPQTTEQIAASKEKEKSNLPPSPPPFQKLDQILEEEQQVVQQQEGFEKSKSATPPLKEETPSSLPPAASPLGPSLLPPPTEVPPAYSLLGGQALALFEKMVSMIMVMHSTGMTETSIHLPEFANAQIIIREYSTAPLNYNIELIGNPEAVAFFQRNLASLRAAFQERKLRFGVNRLETSLASEEFPKIERKKESE